MRLREILSLLACVLAASSVHAGELRVATFAVDATPPVGSALCGASVPPMKGVTDPLSARGIVLLLEGQSPVVLVSVDWVGIANEGNTAWRAALADAVHTSNDRVAVQTIHQHDAPLCDFTVEKLLAAHDMSGEMFDPEFARQTVARAADAARASLKDAVTVTEIGTGKAKVEKVASNRRVYGPDGKVAHVRWTATTDPEVRAAPEGVIDPYLRAVSFWNGDKPVAILTFYATHPQSYYGTGMVSADFPGIARHRREADLPETRHIHFDGAGGNIGAGKYNDGAPENRPVLAARMYDGMKRAFDDSTRTLAAGLGFAWDTVPVKLPLRPEIKLDEEKARFADPKTPAQERYVAASEIAWTERCLAGEAISIGRLRIGALQVLFMPGELFVEYQLAGQQMAPADFVCMAAYGDYGPGYIGTAESYPQGGYETGLHTSRTAPEVEGVLMDAMRNLLVR